MVHKLLPGFYISYGQHAEDDLLRNCQEKHQDTGTQNVESKFFYTVMYHHPSELALTYTNGIIEYVTYTLQPVPPTIFWIKASVSHLIRKFWHS